jgi:hypothetical protein
MALTPTYSWPLPDDTDLVKDGAEAIRDLGNAIDATVSSVPTGLVHIETQTFSAVSSFSFSDNVFTSEYDAYKIVFRVNSTSTANLPNMRLRASGTDETGSNYITQSLQGADTTVSCFRTTATSFSFSLGNRPFYSSIIDLTNPNLSSTTFAITSTITPTSSGLLADLGEYRNHHILSNSYDSCTFIANTGNFTGYAQLYGYRK